MDCVGSSAAFCGAALVARELEGLKFMMGSTMATTKERLAEIGGFEAMVDLHSDDYELGRRIAAHGYRIELLPEPVWMAFPSQTLGAYLRHELRWAIGIRNIRPGGHFGMLFTHGLPWAIAAACVAPSWPLLRVILARILFCDSRWRGPSASGDCAILSCGADLAAARARSSVVFRLARKLWNEPHRVAGKLVHTGKRPDDSRDAARGAQLTELQSCSETPVIHLHRHPDANCPPKNRAASTKPDANLAFRLIPN